MDAINLEGAPPLNSPLKFNRSTLIRSVINAFYTGTDSKDLSSESTKFICLQIVAAHQLLVALINRYTAKT